MVVLDTNVVSELMRDYARPEVLAWLDKRPARDLFVTAVTEAEIRTGIAFLPEGRRRRGLAEAAERAFGSLFAGRGRTPRRRSSDLAGRRSDRGDCHLARHVGGDEECAGFRGHGH